MYVYMCIYIYICICLSIVCSILSYHIIRCRRCWLAARPASRRLPDAGGPIQSHPGARTAENSHVARHRRCTCNACDFMRLHATTCNYNMKLQNACMHACTHACMARSLARSLARARMCVHAYRGESTRMQTHNHAQT